MIDAAILPLKQHFGALDNPRAQHTIEHLLLDSVLITIGAVICGADTWVEIENYGIAKQQWLETLMVENLLGTAQRHPLPRYV